LCRRPASDNLVLSLPKYLRPSCHRSSDSETTIPPAQFCHRTREKPNDVPRAGTGAKASYPTVIWHLSTPAWGSANSAQAPGSDTKPVRANPSISGALYVSLDPSSPRQPIFMREAYAFHCPTPKAHRCLGYDLPLIPRISSATSSAMCSSLRRRDGRRRRPRALVSSW